MANILGIKLSELKPTEVLEKVADFLIDGKQHYIVTPNPEIILTSQKDEEFFYILNQADLSLADGFGLKIAGLIFGDNIPRVTGADMTVEILKMAAEKKIKIMVLNWEDGLSLATDIETALHKKFPGLLFNVLTINRDKFLPEEKIIAINNFAPEILFNTLGFPYQEKLIYHNLEKLPTVKVALGIGGSFDFITEKIKRAPKLFRRLGLEWFWRLLNAFNYRDSTRRLKRIYRATFVFIGNIITVRFIHSFFYRQNVACFLYKREDERLKVLLVEREDEAGHWQLPQGGTEGESIEQAGTRELNEEIGTNKFTARGDFKNVYRYKFKNLRTGKLKLYKYGHKGQNQGLFIAEFTGNDDDIKINFWDHRAWKWVALEDLIISLNPSRRAAGEKIISKFKSLNIK